MPETRYEQRAEVTLTEEDIFRAARIDPAVWALIHIWHSEDAGEIKLTFRQR
jgi:hypothetical protein